MFLIVVIEKALYSVHVNNDSIEKLYILENQEIVGITLGVGL